MDGISRNPSPSIPIIEGIENIATTPFPQQEVLADDAQPQDPLGQNMLLKIAEFEQRLVKLENCYKQIAPYLDLRSLSPSSLDEYSSETEGDEQVDASAVEERNVDLQTGTSPVAISHSELVPAVKVFQEEEHFFNQKFYPLHAIEVLHPITMSQRTSNTESRVVESTTTSNTVSPLPQRIRFRSRWLLNRLADWTGQTLLQEDPRSKQYKAAISLVFLYPFTLFIRYEEQIRRGMEEFRGRYLLKKEEDRQAPQSSAEEEGQLKYLDALECLINKHMEPIFVLRRELRAQMRTHIMFEHLWLLFDQGDIVYERVPPGMTAFLPELWMVTQYGGGRELLNNDSPWNSDQLYKEGSKGIQTPFEISGFGLTKRASKLMNVGKAHTIPRWEGERSIHSLLIFPYKFCRPKAEFSGDDWDAWRKTLVDRGRTYSSFEPGSVVYVEGKGIDERKNLWEYQSEAIVDVDLARLEVPRLFGSRPVPENDEETETWVITFPEFYIYLGDERETLEIPSRVSAIFGGSIILDTIYNDITMEFAYFSDTQRNLAQVLDELNAGKELHLKKFDDFFCLCPPGIPGFILTARKWVIFGIDSLAEDEDRLKKQGMLWKELRLPQNYKTAISATVLRYQSREQVPLYQGKLSSRGAGSIILLQGPPGVGKTFPAEALADHIDKPLYSVTSGELGQTPAEVERELVQIFTRCQKWKCVALIDEADIFIGSRAGSFKRNAILCVFLRQLERYSGILVMTTNRFCDVDPAILQRVHLRLALPAFNRLVTEEVWNLYCDTERVKDLIAETGLERPQVTIEEGVSKWWLIHYDKASSAGPDAQAGRIDDEHRSRSWWSGRDIQYAFRAAAALAVLESSQKRRTRLEADRRTLEQTIRNLQARHRNCESQKEMLEEVGKELAKDMIITEEDEVCLTKRHFDEILKRNETFLTTAEHMQVLSFNGHEIDRVPDEELQYE